MLGFHKVTESRRNTTFYPQHPSPQFLIFKIKKVNELTVEVKHPHGFFKSHINAFGRERQPSGGALEWPEDSFAVSLGWELSVSIREAVRVS